MAKTKWHFIQKTMSQTHLDFTGKFHSKNPHRAASGLHSNLKHMRKISCFFLRTPHRILTNEKEIIANYFFPSAKKGGRNQKPKWDGPVFGFVFLFFFLLPPGLSALWVESISQERWDATCMWEEDCEMLRMLLSLLKAALAEQPAGPVKRERVLFVFNI